MGPTAPGRQERVCVLRLFAPYYSDLLCFVSCDLAALYILAQAKMSQVCGWCCRYKDHVTIRSKQRYSYSV